MSPDGVFLLVSAIFALFIALLVAYALGHDHGSKGRDHTLKCEAIRYGVARWCNFKDGSVAFQWKIGDKAIELPPVPADNASKVDP
ncbi:MAG TPA: hypothetical protein VMY42_10665 [Thermoguttaceae bacterium]|nr:hypothetical protein [Thermoguttaceae bacterium]